MSFLELSVDWELRFLAKKLRARNSYVWTDRNGRMWIYMPEEVEN